VKAVNWSIPYELAAVLTAALITSCSLEPPLKTLPDTEVKISGGGVAVQVHSLSGRIRSFNLENSGFDLLRPWPELELRADFSVEIEDELTGRIMSDIADSVLVREFTQKENSVALRKFLELDGYQIDEEISGNREGVHLRFRAVPQEEEAPLRSVRFTFVFPVARGLQVWAPGGDPPVRVDGRTAVRFVYGPGAAEREMISIPLVSLWAGGDTAWTLAVPLEVRVARVVFEIEPGLVPTGVEPRLDECDRLRITFDLTGAGGGRSLEAGLWLYSHSADWRDALRVFADHYPKYFEPARRVASAEGFLDRVSPQVQTPWQLTALQSRDVRLAGIGWNVFRSGQWVPPQAMRFYDFTWRAPGDSTAGEVSVRLISAAIDNLLLFKLRPILRGAYSSRCDEKTAESAFGDDIARDELGLPLTDEEGQVLMHAAADSPFGKEIIGQQRKMLELYPQAEGFFFAEWEAGGIDFAHDDSLTVIHGRPASLLSAATEGVGRQVIEMVNQARKLAITEVPSRISAARGVDMFCLTGIDLGRIRRTALLGIRRPVISDVGPEVKLSAAESEVLLQEKLLLGVFPCERELNVDQVVSRAYRPLFSDLRGREWLLSPDALALSKGLEGQVFTVPGPERSSEPDVVVTVVQPGLFVTDDVLRDGKVVTVRHPAADQFTRAVWTAASRNTRAVALRVEHVGEGVLSVTLPPFGPAGELRLGRM